MFAARKLRAKLHKKNDIRKGVHHFYCIFLVSVISRSCAAHQSVMRIILSSHYKRKAVNRFGLPLVNGFVIRISRAGRTSIGGFCFQTPCQCHQQLHNYSVCWLSDQNLCFCRPLQTDTVCLLQYLLSQAWQSCVPSPNCTFKSNIAK